MTAIRRVPDERAYLYQIIQTIGSGPDLQTILRGVVDLVTEATACHACFIYLVRDGSLVLRAASKVYAHQEGKVRIPIGEGLTGWVAEARRSAFIREKALEDPRVRVAYFPELDEERFQSLVSVPIFARAGNVIGVITLHAEAPHEFAQADLDLLEHTASLIAGAAENARLYEEATTRVALLTDLSRLAQRIAAATNIEEVLSIVASGGRELLSAEHCEIYLLEPGDRLSLRASSPERSLRRVLDARGPWKGVLGSRAGVEEARHLGGLLWGQDAKGTALFVPMVVGEEQLGTIAAMIPALAADAESVLAAVASHAAVAIKQHQLIEWLREKNLRKDFFEALARGGATSQQLAGQASRLGCDLGAPQVVLHLVSWEGTSAKRRGPSAAPRTRPPTPSWRDLAERVESEIKARYSRCLFDHGERSVRALIPIGEEGIHELAGLIRSGILHRVGEQPAPISVGISNVCHGAASFRHGFEEAAAAAEVGALIRGGPGISTYEDLGPYKYVLLSEKTVRDHYQQTLERLMEYDGKRDARLLDTLETFLDRRGNIMGTSRALYIHPNTLRQRLARVEQVAELDLNQVDWLSLAIAIKVVKLRSMRNSAGADGGEG
ncbi:MAG TPA: GAF domain-containing protein [Actinomycetota bacterium]|nr:GAF domain-containing protein [Actinomycetota bacterium]